MSYRRIIRLVPLMVTAALPLAACEGTQNRGLESVHQPVVSRTDYAFDIAVDGSGDISPSETSRLVGWMRSLQVGYGDQITVDTAGSINAATTRAAVAAQAEPFGLLLANVAPVTGEVMPGTARVIVSRVSARVAGCPDWSRNADTNFDSHTASNYGCATNSTFAAMVANPEDLVRGQAGSETNDPASGSKAIRTFRATAPTGAGGLKSESVGAR